MNLLRLLVPMCACTLAFFLVPPLAVAARPETESTASSSQRRRFSRSFSPMEAQSPVMSAIRVVHRQDLNRKILIALIVASTLLVGILLFLLFFWICRQRSWKNSNGKSKNHNINLSTKGRLQNPIKDRFNSIRMAGKRGSVGVIEYQLLEAATNNFAESNVLGEGGRGKVYKACLDKVLAAVKRFDGDGAEIQREFENEVNWLIRIQHQNIVSLLGYCTHDQTRLLVYEMMQNGSLETLLHGPTEGLTLTWQLRLKIVIDIARALEYLHEHCNPPVVHRDIKSSNILLDSNFNAKLSDFGLAVTAGNENNNLKLSGTLGYVAPEYLLEGKLTDKSDVYSFGVVLLELLMGKKPLEKMSPSRCQSLVTWAMPQLIDRTKLPNIVDPVIRNTMDLKHLYQVAAVAVLCIQPEPSYRPLITDVLHSLIPLLPAELGGSLRMS